VAAIVTRGDAAHLRLPDETVDLIVTSPPYFGLRSYQDGGAHYDGQVGDEATPAEYLDALIACTAEWMRVLKPGGSIFVNLGDKYSGAQQQNSGRQSAEASSLYWQKTNPKNTGIPAKSLMGFPWRYALRCVDDLGLILRAEIIWAKPNGLPESVTDRVRRSHEQVFHLVKQPRYYSAVDEVREAQETADRKGPRRSYPPGSASSMGANGEHQAMTGPFAGLPLNPLGKLPGSVWEIPTAPLKVPDHLGVDHFAAYPPELVKRIVLGWSPREVCSACGEGRRPVVAKPGLLGGDNNPFSRDGSRTASTLDGGATQWKARMAQPDYISGYACACPTCPACDGTGKSWLPQVKGCRECPPTTPGVVLDPFGGTGTTALVASAYGRVGISVDLSADYCRLAQWRTQDPGERARVLEVAKPEKPVEGQLGLFEGLGA
jgi:DNA modification methylase